MTFWVATVARDTLFAYKASDGTRDFDKDIDVPADVCNHKNVEGTWLNAAGNVLYVATPCDSKKLFGIDLSNGAGNASHDSTLDISLRQGHGPAGGRIKGLWSDGHIV